MQVPTESSKEVTMGWDFPWGFCPSHFNWLTMGDVIVLTIVILIIVIVGVWITTILINNDRYQEGFHDGVYCSIVGRVKQRFHRTTNVVECFIPEEEYRSVIDQFTGDYYLPRWAQQFSNNNNSNNRKEGNECTNS